ncbi:MAG: class I SAM-dependent DNA methyltransferase, partial [Victivallales bacterium]|nr:class I SAM-dependent DNA methyltransferase [Victivallales bacterium]
YGERARWIVISNFRTFLVYDMERPGAAPEEVTLEELAKAPWRLAFLADAAQSRLQRETAISLEAGELVHHLYEGLLVRYGNDEPETLRHLNVLCVRLVFCLYAEDAGLFATHTAFHDYLARFPARDLRRALRDLFEVLDTPAPNRDPYLDEELAAFPYVNGGLFEDKSALIPQFDDDLKALLLAKASDEFDWSQISPTIFGSIFESTLNPENRRAAGMHYTTIENIHKVIDPLFLDGLKAELEEILRGNSVKNRTLKLHALQEKVARLVFLDPACGSGNFLTETYLALRRLENRILAAFFQDQPEQREFNLGDLVKVSIHQFYGIEINDFAAAVAKTALWIAESQMFRETDELLQGFHDFLPLKSNANIVEGNALRIDWNAIVPKEKLSYIMGNPPFIGARVMSSEQKQDVLDIFGQKWPNLGNLDYVCCWYKKSAEYMQGTAIRAALVSTNSITQGGQVADLWQGLVEQYGVGIDFAHRTFKWFSEAKDMAQVHVVIVGFSVGSAGSASTSSKTIFDGAIAIPARHINPYLIDAPDVFIASRPKPLCDVPEIGIGNKPIDGGNYLFTEEEMREFLKKEPAARPYFRPWYGAEEFIHRKPRYCLWLGDCTPAQLHAMPQCLKRVEAVRNFRLASKSEGTRKLADRPIRFHVENMPTGNYIVIPETSSERRQYIPMGFMTPDVFCSNLVRLIPNATLYHFGVLTSDVHNAWTRVVCGRLKSDYRYSKDIVYNNFPWPEATPEQRERIAATAQAILDARGLYPDSSLADLYDPLIMPDELRKAHRANDSAVRAAYGFPNDLPEADVVARLFALR